MDAGWVPNWPLIESIGVWASGVGTFVLALAAFWQLRQGRQSIASAEEARLAAIRPQLSLRLEPKAGGTDVFLQIQIDNVGRGVALRVHACEYRWMERVTRPDIYDYNWMESHLTVSERTLPPGGAASAEVPYPVSVGRFEESFRAIFGCDDIEGNRYVFEFRCLSDDDDQLYVVEEIGRRARTQDHLDLSLGILATRAAVLYRVGAGLDERKHRKRLTRPPEDGEETPT